MRLVPYADLNEAQRAEVAASYHPLAVSEHPTLMRFYVTKRRHLAKRKKPLPMTAGMFQREMLEAAKGQAAWLKQMGETLKFYDEGKP